MVCLLVSHRAFAQHVPHRLLVKFTPATNSAAMRSILAYHSAQDTGEIPRIGVHILRLPDAANEEQVATAFRRHANVEFAEVDKLFQAARATSVTPSDPLYSGQWYLRHISAPAAWSITTGSPAFTVAVLDSGCDPTHPDLQPKYVSGWNFIDNNTNTADISTHGTTVAGCVGAIGNNGIGVASVDWQCRIMPVRIAYKDSSGNLWGSTSAIASGLQWAVDHGANVCNLSYAVYGSSTVVTAAHYVWNRGGVTVISAGNSGANQNIADDPTILYVAATDSSDTRCSFSDYGPYVDLAAPGDTLYSTWPGGGYQYVSGTSYSAPVVAGAFTLVWSANPSLTNQQVRDILFQTATDLGAAGRDPYYGWGLINVDSAVQTASGITVNAPPTCAITSPASGGTVSGTVTAITQVSDSATVTSVDFLTNGVVTSTMTTAPYSFTWNTTNAPNGACTLTARAHDSNGLVIDSSPVQVTVNNTTGADTIPPTCQIVSPADGSHLGSASIMKVTATASDNIGVATVSFYADGRLTGTVTSAPYTCSFNTRKWASGAHTISPVARDAAGNASTPFAIVVYK
jgi:subtilisin family serine protease